jgi:hypothetical protein
MMIGELHQAPGLTPGGHTGRLSGSWRAATLADAGAVAMIPRPQAAIARTTRVLTILCMMVDASCRAARGPYRIASRRLLDDRGGYHYD